MVYGILLETYMMNAVSGQYLAVLRRSAPKRDNICPLWGNVKR